MSCEPKISKIYKAFKKEGVPFFYALEELLHIDRNKRSMDMPKPMNLKGVVDFEIFQMKNDNFSFILHYIGDKRHINKLINIFERETGKKLVL